MSDGMIWHCIVCEKAVTDFEPQMCCSGISCGCMGLPIEPPLCSQECTEKLFGGQVK